MEQYALILVNDQKLDKFSDKSSDMLYHWLQSGLHSNGIPEYQ
ncbi:hypothetical protein Salpa_0271 [Sporomusa sp. KB1]|jgi:molybdopterin biosynthesis enzyme MoaB|nr:hypothetical protein Salpa_0271 [Sporomusa sp. KB1]